MKLRHQLGLCFGTNLAMKLCKPVFWGGGGFCWFWGGLSELFHKIGHLKEV